MYNVRSTSPVWLVTPLCYSEASKGPRQPLLHPTWPISYWTTSPAFGHSQLFLDKKRDLNVSTSKIVFLKVIINWALIHYLHGFNYSALCWSRMSATRLKKCLGETDLKIHEGVLGFPDNCQQCGSNLSATYCTHDVTQCCACYTHSVDSILSTWRTPCHARCTHFLSAACCVRDRDAGWMHLQNKPASLLPCLKHREKCLFKNCCFSLCSSSRKWHIM